jgi:hypothetical protein
MKSAVLICVSLVALANLNAQDAPREAGLRAFRDVASVLTSPRCINCHVPVNSPPLQGDDSHPHIMKVARGIDGKGDNAAMRCSTCHQEANVATLHAPPGAPGWSMPSAATPMTWLGLTTAQVCRVLKDPQTNGKKSLAALIDHVTTDDLVNWGWNPGLGRSLPPLSHPKFVDAFKAWVAAGAPCPE